MGSEPSPCRAHRVPSGYDVFHPVSLGADQWMPRFHANAAGCSTRRIRDNKEPSHHRWTSMGWHALDGTGQRGKKSLPWVLPGQLPSTLSPVTDHFPPVQQDGSFMLSNPPRHPPSLPSSHLLFVHFASALQPKGGKKKGGGD